MKLKLYSYNGIGKYLGWLLNGKLSSEGGIVQCSVIDWRDDACRLWKAVPKCLETLRHRCRSVLDTSAPVPKCFGAEVSWGQSVSSPSKCSVVIGTATRNCRPSLLLGFRYGNFGINTYEILIGDTACIYELITFTWISRRKSFRSWLWRSKMTRYWFRSHTTRTLFCHLHTNSQLF